MKDADVTLKWVKSSRKELARKRWNILADALFSRKFRTFTSADDIEKSLNFFEIFSVIPLPAETKSRDDTIACWYRYSAQVADTQVSVKIRHPSQSFTVEELTGFNNTGNVRVWPSEEILAYVCLKHGRFFADKRILEVGGGMSCLAGILLSQHVVCDAVHVTDGNRSAVENVEKIVSRNLAAKCRITCDVLLWRDYAQHSTVYDVILAADCLFFDECRTDLIRLMYSLLKYDGVVLIAAPKRGDTLLKFMNETRQAGFMCTVYYCYDEIIWSQHLKLLKERDDYDENLHYPLFLVLEKCVTSLTSTFKSGLWQS